MYRTNTKVKVSYVPHGINSEKFYPIDENHTEYLNMLNYKKELFGVNNPEFVLFYNSRNIRRKMTSDIIFAFGLFLKTLSEEDAKKCFLVLHTVIADENGTDLMKVKENFCPDANVIITNKIINTNELNYLYNIADVTINVASNEGWGLSTSESLMAGTPIIVNVTGGLQDQCRFEDENGLWITFSPEFPSNHDATYTKCGEWAIPIFPAARNVQGSIPTPYIIDDRCRIEDVRNAIKKMYSFGREERKRRGLVGREWVTSTESKISAKEMSHSFMKLIDKTINEFVPRKRFSLFDTKIKRTDYPLAYKVADKNVISINEEITK